MARYFVKHSDNFNFLTYKVPAVFIYCSNTVKGKVKSSLSQFLN